METKELPTFVQVDFDSVYRWIARNGPWLAPPTINARSARTALHPRGMSCYEVRDDQGNLIAYSLENKRNQVDKPISCVSTSARDTKREIQQ